MITIKAKAVVVSIVMIAAFLLSVGIGYAAEKPILTMWRHKHFVEASNEWWEQTAREFEKEGGVKVEIFWGQAEDLKVKIATSTVMGTLPDILWSDNPFVGVAHSMGIARDVSDLVEEIGAEYGGWNSTAVQEVTIDGKQWALPWEYHSMLLFARKSIFSQVGIQYPNNWNEVLEAAKKITASTDVYGFGQPISRNDDWEFFFNSLLWSYGASIVKEDGKTVDFYSPETIDVVKFIQDIWNAKVLPPGVTGWDAGGNNRSFESGESAMVQNSGSIWWSLQARGLPLADDTQLLLPPKGPVDQLANGVPFFNIISRTAKYPDLAKDFLKFAYEKERYENYLMVCKGAFQPRLRYFTDNPVSIWKESDNNRLMLEAVKYNRYVGYPGPVTAVAGKIFAEHLTADMIHEIVLQGRPVEEVVKEYAEQIEATYVRYGS